MRSALLDLMKEKKSRMAKDKKGAGLITGLVFGIVGLVVGLIIAFVIIQTLNNASLLGTATAEQNATTDLIGNFTTGIGNVSSKIPTILLIAAVVLLLSVLLILWGLYKKMNVGGGGSEL